VGIGRGSESHLTLKRIWLRRTRGIEAALACENVDFAGQVTIGLSTTGPQLIAPGPQVMHKLIHSRCVQTVTSPRSRCRCRHC
jgi:hypothetical protein